MLWAPEIGDEKLYGCFRDNNLSKVKIYNMLKKLIFSNFQILKFKRSLMKAFD